MKRKNSQARDKIVNVAEKTAPSRGQTKDSSQKIIPSQSKNSKRFQEVCQTGTAAARAETAKVGKEEDDDVDFIRSKNAQACQKRQKKAETQAHKLTTPAANQKPAKKKLKAIKHDRSSSPAKSKISSSQKRDQKDDTVPSDHSDSESEDGDEGEEEEELVMRPSHYRRQQEYKFEEESGEGSDFEELNVVFDHFNPKETDFGGIRQFLRDILCGSDYDVGGLVDIIISQSGAVGTVVKVADEEEVYGVTSVINLTHYKSSECVKQVTSFILSKCPQEHRPLMEKFLRSSEDGSTGFIINERMVNMPNEMALPLMSSMFDELQWSQEDQAEDVRDRYKFDHFLVMTRVLHMASSKKQRGKRSKSKQPDDAEEDCIYLKAEDEVFRRHALVDYEFKMGNRQDSDGLSNYALVMVVPASAAAAIVSGVREAVGEEAIRNQMALE